MKEKIRLISAILLVILGCCQIVHAMSDHHPLKVVTSSEDLAAIAQAVGGEKVEVFSIGKGYQDPHFVPPKPSYILKLQNADLLVRTGMELDIWLDPLVEGSRNRRIFRNGPAYVDASQGIHVLGAPASKLDRSLGDVHPYGNPHYWLDPVNAKYISLNIANGLKRIDPADAAYFDAHRLLFLKALAAKLTVWIKKAEPLKGVKVITYHDSWPYFEQRFGLDIVGHIEPKPGIPPSPRYLAELMQNVKVQHVKLILVEPYYNRSAPDMIARATGAKVIILPPSVGGLPGVDNYFALFDTLINTLLKSADVKSPPSPLQGGTSLPGVKLDLSSATQR